MEKEIEVYNVKKIIEENTENKYTSYKYDEYMILQGPKGVAIFTSEGVGNVYPSIQEEYIFEVKENNKNISLIPYGSISLPIDFVLKNATKRKVSVRSFIRSFGARLEFNFREVLRAIDDIGLNHKEYYAGDNIAQLI